MKLFRKTAGVVLSFALAAALILPMGVKAADETGAAEDTETTETTETPEGVLPKINISVGRGQKAPEYEVGQSVERLVLNIENTGNVDAQNVTVHPMIEDTDAWPFYVENWNDDVVIDRLSAKPGENSVEIEWKNLKVRDNAGANNYKLNFQVTYDDGNKTEQVTKYVWVHTKEKPKAEAEEAPEAEAQGGGEIFNGDVSYSGGSSSDKATVPRVIVTGFNTDPGAVNAGSDFKLVVHLKNTSSRTAVSNMLFDLQAPSSGSEGAAEAPAFLPSSGSSTIYLDNIPAGGTKDITIDLNARADLVQKPYSISMSMKYEDSSAQQFESSSSLAIPVKQAARFEFSDLEIAPEAVSVGEEANVTCSLYNTGRIKLYNVKAKFQGEGIEAKEVFVGNVDSGATGSIDGILTATQETAVDQKFKMVVSYEDNAGNPATVEKEFSLQITPAQAPVDMMSADIETEKQGVPVIPIVIGAIVVAAVVVTAIILKKRKKKKESVEEEDLLNEVDRFTEDE